jgi:NADPH-dependent 2,4-dienoyl-CoA reductase/sulfur reductase-like enzyme
MSKPMFLIVGASLTGAKAAEELRSNGFDGRVVVVGAGWIGSEFAASARQRGLEVTVIDPQPLPNGRISHERQRLVRQPADRSPDPRTAAGRGGGAGRRRRYA